MNAALTFGPGDIRVESLQDPIPGVGEVLVKVESCGICGGDYSAHKPGVKKLPKLKDPIIAGHEVAGTIVDSGKGVSGLPIGTKVAVSPNRPCGSCLTCHKGMSHLCQNRKPRVLEQGGGFAEYTSVFSEQCFPISADTSLLEAAVAEPLACCIHSTNRIHVQQGDDVAIIGAGLNAQISVQLTRLKGARRVTVIDSISKRLMMASVHGADVVIDSSVTSPEQMISHFPRGADVVINTRGAMEFTKLAFDICAVGARILCYGVAPVGETIPIEPNMIFRKEIQLIGGRSFNNTFSAAVDLIASKRVQVDPLVTRTVNLERYSEIINSPSEDHIKTVVVPNQKAPEKYRW